MLWLVTVFLNAICLFSEGYRNHRVVTVPMNFKKPDVFFFQKLVLPGFWGPWFLVAIQTI